MNKFEINVCPLCSKVLKYRLASKVNVYSCPTTFEFKTATGLAVKTHYEVEHDDKESIQHIVIGPWAIDNFSRDNLLPAARVYKLYTSESEDGHNKWRFITDAPEIHADTEDNMLARLNTLVMFL